MISTSFSKEKVLLQNYIEDDINVKYKYIFQLQMYILIKKPLKNSESLRPIPDMPGAWWKFNLHTGSLQESNYLFIFYFAALCYYFVYYVNKKTSEDIYFTYLTI